MEKEILMTDVIEHCIKEKNFSTAYIQKTFNMPLPLVCRLLDACTEAKVITGEVPRTFITLKEYKKNYKQIEKVLMGKNLF